MLLSRSDPDRSRVRRTVRRRAAQALFGVILVGGIAAPIPASAASTPATSLTGDEGLPAPPSTTEVIGAEEAGFADLVIPLNATFTLSGVLRDEAGAPVVGA